jgi:hypothetical protein
MSLRKVRWLGFGLVTTAGAGVLALTTTMSAAPALADGTTSDVVAEIGGGGFHGTDLGLIMGGSGLPIPGSGYVDLAQLLYLDNPLHPNFPGVTTPGALANGLFTPEGLYPLTGVHTLLLNYPTYSTATPVNTTLPDESPVVFPAGFPSTSSSVGQGIEILNNNIQANIADGSATTVFGYSQSSTISSYEMQLLDPSNTPSTDPVQFLLIGDPSAPNGGLLERFAGFETTSGTTVSDPLSLPSLGVVFNSATPANDFSTNVYSLEYDGFADFPRYPINFLADLNAFLGIEDLHGTYLSYPVNGTGPTPADIAHAVLLPGSALSGTTDSLTNYYMIDTIGGEPITAPLVSLLPKPLQELLGPDLTYLINLGYGDGSLGWSNTAANVNTPFGLLPDVNPSTVFSTLISDTEKGFQNLMSGTDPYASAATGASSATSLTDIWSALSADAANPSATLTELVNAFSSAASTAYSTLLPLTDIANALLTSIPAYDVSLISTNLSSGDLIDAFGLPIAANTALDTLAAGFAYEVISSAISAISADFSSLF